MPLVSKNHNKLLLEADPSLVSISTDAMRLKQILINLLSNASKFTNDGTITLGLQPDPDPDFVRFYVRDTGIGMSEEQMSRIFQEFAQADESTTKNFGGTGLGLALCQRFTQMPRGSLWVEGELGKGSVFLAKLPLG